MENPGEDESLFDQLPDHCLEHIFSFLSIRERLDIEEVCKRWCIISKEGWRDIEEFKIDHDDYSEDEIHVIMKRCGRFLKKLCICIKHLECKCLSIAIRYCQLDQLEEIGIIISDDYEIKEHHVNMSNLTELFRKTRKLVALTIKGDLQYYNTDHLNSLNLEILRIENRGMTALPVKLDIERFPNLKEVSLRAVMIIPHNEMEIKEDSLKGLEKLDVLHCYVPQYNIPRLKTFLNLQELVLRIGVYNVEDEDVRDIASHCHKIKKLSLWSFANMSPKCFKYLGKMPSLEVLTLQRFRKIKNFDILPLTNVHQLFLQKCGIINEDGFLKLIVNSTRLAKLQILKVEVALCRRFLEGVGRIFHGGQREKHLSLVISVRGPIESFRTLQKKIEHPLLDLELSIQPPSIVGWGSDL